MTAGGGGEGLKVGQGGVEVGLAQDVGSRAHVVQAVHVFAVGNGAVCVAVAEGGQVVGHPVQRGEHGVCLPAV